MIYQSRSIPLLFANGTPILFSHSNFKGFEESINTVLETFNSSFKRNLLPLNFKKKKLYPFCNKGQYSYLYANPHIPIQNS